MDRPIYDDRRSAGKDLARALTGAVPDDAVVVAVPRGGVPPAFEVAVALSLPLDVLVVRKLGAPGQPELAMGAIASGDVRVVNDDVTSQIADAAAALERVEAHERPELARRERVYRGNRPEVDVAERTVVLVDDGLATGASMRVAIQAARERGASRVVVGVPVGAREVCDQIALEVDDLCCLHRPERLGSVGAWYRAFLQTSDEEVRDLLDRAAAA